MQPNQQGNQNQWQTSNVNPANQYSSQWTENQGRTQVKENGYTNTQKDGNKTVTTSFQSSSKVTIGEPVVTTSGSRTVTYGTQQNVNSNSGTAWTQGSILNQGNSQNRQFVTEYTTQTSNQGQAYGQGLTQGLAYGQAQAQTQNKELRTSEYSSRLSKIGQGHNAETVVTTTTYGQSGNRIETSGLESNQQRNSQYGASRHSIIQKGSYLVGEKEHEGRLVSESEGQKRVVEIREGQQVTKSETVTMGETRVVREVELQKTYREQARTEMRTQEQDVEFVKRDKIIEIVKEVPVRVERYVDRIVDIYVDVPIERTIEKEKITEVVVEKPIEKIVEIPIEQIYEIPVEKIIEKPVEIQKFVEVPVERIINKPYDVVRENIIWQDRIIDVEERHVKNYKGAQVLDMVVDYQQNNRVVERPKYVDNLIEKEVRVPREIYIEVPKERIVENKVKQVIDRPVTKERLINRDIEVPRENVVYRDVEFLTERPIYVENIIEKHVPIEKVVEKEVRIEVEHITEKPVYIDNIIHKPVDHIVQVPVPVDEIIEDEVEQIIENPIPIEQVIERPVEKIIRKSVPFIRQVQVPFE